MPALTEPHDPKASLTGSGVLPPSPEKALLPKLECSPRGRQRHDGKWVKPQQLATTNLSKAQILLIRFYSMGNLTVLWTMVQNTHRIIRLKVRNLKEMFDMQAVTLLVCPCWPLQSLRSLPRVLGCVADTLAVFLHARVLFSPLTRTLPSQLGTCPWNYSSQSPLCGHMTKIWSI